MQSIMQIPPTLLVMLGGGLGAAGRYHLGRALTHFWGVEFPYGTFAANILGGAAMGLLVAWLAAHTGQNEPWRLLLGVGLLGGFTTFSAFSLEVVNMIIGGDWAVAIAYVLASAILAVAAVFGALALGRMVF